MMFYMLLYCMMFVLMVYNNVDGSYVGMDLLNDGMMLLLIISKYVNLGFDYLLMFLLWDMFCVEVLLMMLV